MSKIIGITFPKQSHGEKSKKPEKEKQGNDEKRPQK